jgi:hypothetical protein
MRSCRFRAGRCPQCGSAPMRCPLRMISQNRKKPRSVAIAHRFGPPGENPLQGKAGKPKHRSRELSTDHRRMNAAPGVQPEMSLWPDICVNRKISPSMGKEPAFTLSWIGTVPASGIDRGPSPAAGGGRRFRRRYGRTTVSLPPHPRSGRQAGSLSNRKSW